MQVKCKSRKAETPCVSTVSPLMIADSVDIDPTLVRVITLPNVPAVRACSLRHDRPYEYEDVVRLYEEAFR